MKRVTLLERLIARAETNRGREVSFRQWKLSFTHRENRSIPGHKAFKCGEESDGGAPLRFSESMVGKDILGVFPKAKQLCPGAESLGGDDNDRDSVGVWRKARRFASMTQGVGFQAGM